MPALLLWASIIPVVIFLAVCTRYLSPIPVLDDYYAVLLFLHDYSKLPTVGEKLVFVLTSQHNEYKVIYAHAVIAAQYALQGHTSLFFLSFLGDLQIPVIGLLLWRCFLPGESSFATKLALFLPILLLTFQMNYGENLDWPMPCLQNIGVVMFALLALSQASQPGKGSFAVGCCGFVLCIAASGNGLALIPVGALMLLQQKRFARAAFWLILSAVCASAYFYKYDVSQTKHSGESSVLAASHHLSPWFALSFLGSSVGIDRPIVRYFASLVGLGLCAVAIMAVRRKYYRENAALAYFALFLFLTAVAVSGTRSSLGLHQSFAERYKLYSDFLLVCAYDFGLYLFRRTPLERRVTFYRVALAATVLVFVLGDVTGSLFMRARNLEIRRGMELYVSSHGNAGPVPPEKAGQNYEYGLNPTFRDALAVTTREGIYRIPAK